MSHPIGNKTVCHVTSVHPWDDIRIFKKEACSTAKFAKKTYLVATNAPDRCIDNVNVVSVTFPEKHSRLKRILFLKKRVINRALELDADIYHLHDPELLSAVKQIRKAGKYVIYDSHEDVPKTILSKKWLKPNFLRNWISKWYNRYEKSIARKCSGIISVLPEITSKFENKHLETIYNYPFSRSTTKTERKSKIRLIYVGGLTRIRGIKDICEVLEKLPTHFELVLVGKWESIEFQAECQKEVSDSSRLIETGFVDHEVCQMHLEKADIGLAMLHKEPNYMNSLPIKAYEYAIHGLPVVMSDIPYWMNEFGSFAEFANPMSNDAIRDKILMISENYEDHQTKVFKFNDTVLAHKNWSNEEQKLINFYESILQ